MKKRFFILMMTLLPLAAKAYDAKVDGIFYNLSGTEAEVTYKKEGKQSYSGVVTIPSSITYKGKTYNVTSIGSNAFNGCVDLTSVTIPNSVTSIEKKAFYNCSSLASVTIPNSVTSIRDWAFFKCSGLASVDIPNSVKDIGIGAFGCSGLKSITIPNSLTSVGVAAFEGCI